MVSGMGKKRRGVWFSFIGGKEVAEKGGKTPACRGRGRIEKGPLSSRFPPRKGWASGLGTERKEEKRGRGECVRGRFRRAPSRESDLGKWGEK